MKYEPVVLEEVDDIGLLAPIVDRLEEAIPYTKGTHDMEDIAEGILTGEFQLWAGEKSTMLTCIEHYPRGRNCHVFLAAGDLAELREILTDVETWGTEHGCSRVTITGRKGWVRELSDRGYELSAVTIQRELP